MAEVGNTKEKKSGGSGGIVLIILIVVLVGFIVLVKMDVFGLGTNVLGPALQDVPVLNLILPEMPEETVEGLVDVPEITYTFETVEEALEVIKERDKQLKELQDTAEINNEAYAELLAENERLQVFEDNQAEYEADKEAFDLLVAENADPSDYMDFVDSAYPENALAIYESLVQEDVINTGILESAAIYESMKSDDAAEILEITHLSDIDMVAQILDNMEAANAGAILAEMEPTTADRISRYMYPQEN